MALGTDYAAQDCGLARALELVGERWTLLIVRDALFGVRRFGDFHAHLDVSRAVLTGRLTGLVDAGLLERVPRGGHDDYVPTEALEDLWPAICALSAWGDRQTAKPAGRRRVFRHRVCGTPLDARGTCSVCDESPAVRDIDTEAGPGYDPTIRSDAVSMQLRLPRRLLEPVR